MSAVLPIPRLPVVAGLVLALALGCLAAPPGKPQPLAAAPFNSPDFRFHILLPTRDPLLKPAGTATVFISSAPDQSYTVKVVVTTLDSAAAKQEVSAYFREFKKGMRDAGATVVDCLPGTISGAPAERCLYNTYDTTGKVLLVRRDGVAYYVSAEQPRGNSKDAEIEASLRSFWLLPEVDSYTFAEQNFRAGFPTRPKMTEAGGGVVVKAYAGRDRYMTMVSIDNLPDAQASGDPARVFPAVERSFEQGLREHQVRLSECAAVNFIGGHPAHFCKYEDDKNTGKLLLVRRDKKIYSVLATQPRGNGSDEEIDLFVRTFKFLN